MRRSQPANERPANCWRAAVEFVGFMPLLFGAVNLLTSAATALWNVANSSASQRSFVDRGYSLGAAAPRESSSLLPSGAGEGSADLAFCGELPQRGKIGCWGKRGPPDCFAAHLGQAGHGRTNDGAPHGH